MMINKRWKENRYQILWGSSIVAIFVTITSISFQASLWFRIGLLLFNYSLIAAMATYMHDKHAGTFTKIFPVEYEYALQTVEVTLRKSQVGYTRQITKDVVYFRVNSSDIALGVEDYPLYMMYEPSTQMTDAARITIKPGVSKDKAFLQSIQDKLDAAFNCK